MPLRACLILLLGIVSADASAQFNPPLGAAPQVSGPRTQVMTLGSTHLSAHKDQWKAQWLEPLVGRLVAWRPQVITVEAMSGAQCEMMRNAPQLHADAYTSYCPDASKYQQALRMSQAQAEAEVAATLAKWPQTPTPAQRRQLAMLFLAAGDRPSALVQWLRLAPAERREAESLNAGAVKQLNRTPNALNETYDLGSVVAARVGLERVYSVDDHSSDAVFNDLDPAYGPWQEKRFEGLRDAPRRKAEDAREAAVHDADSLLAYYRQMNAPGEQDAQVQADFGGALADPAPQRFGRRYAGWWDLRNLRMLANMRQAYIDQPGARVLNIVGASHKPWYDQWSRQMSDVSVVDAHEVLGR